MIKTVKECVIFGDSLAGNGVVGMSVTDGTERTDGTKRTGETECLSLKEIFCRKIFFLSNISFYDNMLACAKGRTWRSVNYPTDSIAGSNIIDTGHRGNPLRLPSIVCTLTEGVERPQEMFLRTSDAPPKPKLQSPNKENKIKPRDCFVHCNGTYA
jgi:hypothetical protein